MQGAEVRVDRLASRIFAKFVCVCACVRARRPDDRLQRYDVLDGCRHHRTRPAVQLSW